ncbi:Metallo-hydrolase oxidoreductase [Pyrrhoderma noxium]|uniref:Metallo-hydrolase oxidoreductase n=1 Tax=Pyrrhoderma noxium TaxID=2282107 RepID=A0A286U9K1_9AGAM|nr:Metallo-hydrolase oxidoreductase [Pyrrhoderma noxium]
MAQLPPPHSNQAYCDVSALEGGLLDMPAHLFVTSAPKTERNIVPSLSFLITHLNTDTRIVFDLGIRADIENYPELTRKRLSDVFKAQIPNDVPSSLKKGGLEPSDIKYVCLSHCHWDHTGNTDLFSNARFIVGSEVRKLFQPGYPEDPTSPFPSSLLPKGRTEFLDVNSKGWGPIGPFPRALDYFDDGSLYFVDAPGHLHGHLNLLARTSADGGWIYLAGDAAHDWRLIRGQGEIAMYQAGDGGGLTCIHHDKGQAEATIKRIASLLTLPRVRVILAHDGEWYNRSKDSDQFWPGKIYSL